MDRRIAARLKETVTIPRIVVMLVLVGLLVVYGLEKRRERVEEDVLPKVDALGAKIDAYRREQFGPPNLEAYRTALGFPGVPVPGAGTAGAFPSPEALARLGRPMTPGAIAQLPELRNDLEAHFKETEPTWAKIRQVIEGGGYYQPFTAPRSGLEFLGLSPQPYGSVGFSPPVAFAGDNCLKGYLLLADGRTTEAVEQFALGLRFAQRFFGCMPGGRQIGDLLLGQACVGFDQLLRRPRDAPTLRRALAACRDVEIHPAEYDAGLYAGEVLLFYRDVLLCPSDEILRPLPWRFETLFHWRATYSLGIRLAHAGLTRKENQRWFARVSDRQKQATLRQKITSWPATRKHLRHILETEPYFRSKPRPPILAEKDLEGLPPELEIMMRLPIVEYERQFAAVGTHNRPMSSALAPVVRDRESWGRDMTGAIQLDLLRVALAARLFQSERGVWPANVAELVAADLISSPGAYIAGGITIADLYSKYAGQPEQVDLFVLWQIIDGLILETPNWIPGRGAAWQPYPRLRFDPPERIRLAWANIPKRDVKIVEIALRRLAPFIQNVRVVRQVPGEISPRVARQIGPQLPELYSFWSQAVIEADFHRPKQFWWAYVEKPDRERYLGAAALAPSPDLPVVYKLGQFVGWE